MLDREVAMRADKRVRNRLASAKMRFPEACIEDIDFAAPRGLDRRNTMALAQGEWLKAHDNLIITGQTGTRQVVVGLRLRPASGTARSFRALCARAAPVRGSGARSPRWPLSPPHRQAHPRPIAHSRRLRDPQSHRPAALPPVRNHRGTLSAKIHPDHRPSPGGQMAWLARIISAIMKTGESLHMEKFSRV